MTLRILLADDQELVRTGLCTLSERDGDITVVAQAADGQRAEAPARTHRPEVVLIEPRMPGMDGITATGLILAESQGQVCTPGATRVRLLVSPPRAWMRTSSRRCAPGLPDS